MDKQLVDFVREQVKHGVKPEVLRYNLENKGWNKQEVNEALREAHAYNNRNLAVIGISVVVVAFLALILISLTNKTVVPDVQSPVPGNDGVSSLGNCASIIDGDEKNSCYIGLVQKDYDCEELTDDVERTFCFRALEYSLISQIVQ